MCYTHKSSVGPTDYRCHSNRWSPPGALPSSCPPLSQPTFASELLTCLGIWWYTVGNRTSPAIKQNPCKRKVAVSVLLSFWTLSLFCETPLVAPWKSPHWHHRCLSPQGTCCSSTDLLNNVAFDPLRSHPEGHSAVEVTTLPWKPEKSSCHLSFSLYA